MTDPETVAPVETPAAEADETEVEDTQELLMMLGVLVVLLIVAAVVFLFVPTSWIGAKVEVIVHQ